MKSVAVLGAGALGSLVARGICDQLGEFYRLSGVYDRDRVAASSLASECGCPHRESLRELLAARPDYVVEAAGPQALVESAVPILRAGAHLLVLSVGAFAEEGFLEEVRAAALENDAKVHIVSGAIGGYDLVQAAGMVGPFEARIVNVKNPKGLAGAPWLHGRSLSKERIETLFTGTAREAIKAFPNNVNVAVGLALAANGVEETEVLVVSDPAQDVNVHRIILQGAFGDATIEVRSEPSEDNPRSSAIAAFSVLAKLKNLASPISFC